MSRECRVRSLKSSQRGRCRSALSRQWTWIVALLAYLCLGRIRWRPHCGDRADELGGYQLGGRTICVLKPKQVTRWCSAQCHYAPGVPASPRAFCAHGRTDLSHRRAAALRTPQPAGEGLGAKRIGRTTACVTASQRITCRSTTIIPS